MFNQPSLEQWRKLHEGAQRFKDTAPWEWMSDDEVFGVSHAGEVGYCSIIGNLEETFGLVVYPGGGRMVFLPGDVCRTAPAQPGNDHAAEGFVAGFRGQEVPERDRDRRLEGSPAEVQR